MPAKIRLARHGKKGKPFYHIVVADGRAPRDGKFIEKIGTYNPITNPAEIKIDFDKALEWLNKGAQPTETVRSILSFKGILYKNHLLKGVKKGALTEQEAEAKFQAWLTEKENKIETRVKQSEEKLRAEQKKRLEEETKIKEARAEELAKKRAEEVEKEVSKVQEAEAERENATIAGDEKKEEPREVKKEELKEEKKEEPKEEKKEEPKEEKKEEPKEEKKEEPQAEKKEEPKEDKKEEPKKEEN